ncbi:efflux RND transporter periplasmic adaptor subunit [Sphingomonas sp. FW199]|uniref:efflux RND transporter periplasmic adaptor subunit n=1 Tax=Sphingomonas sp. FW199 TaxID=3400217 RepID=UPI003CECC6A5
MHKQILILSLALMAAGCGGGSQPAAKGRAAPLVSVSPVVQERFVERIEAVGTANANEQVTLAAPVTERIERLAFDDGDFIRKGDVVAVLARGQETAQLDVASARAAEAEKQLSRLAELRQRGFATQSALDAQTALAAQARAQAAEARASIGDRVLRAPFSGYVSLRNISAGAIVSAGTEVAQISDLSVIKLDFSVPETMLSALKQGQPIEAQAAAYPDERFRGRIDVIDAIVNPETRAVTVRALIPNPDARLKPGMLLTVVVEAQARTAPSVPELAVVGDGDENFVFVVEQGKAKRVAVRTGIRQGGKVEILSGLGPDARVITEGVVKVADGQQVRLNGQEQAATGIGKPTGGSAN